MNKTTKLENLCKNCSCTNFGCTNYLFLMRNHGEGWGEGVGDNDFQKTDKEIQGLKVK